MLVISILFTLIMVAGIYFYWKKNRAAPANRYRKTKYSTPSYSKTAPTLDESDDANDVFGLDRSEKKSVTTVAASEEKSVQPQSDCIVVIYLMAPKDTLYAGYELLQALLSAGMRYGKQRIFHRHAHKDGRGEILFHCASAVEPGTFDLTKMGTFSCKGLCLFFKASAVDEPLSTFDCLLETVDQLVEDIGGDVLDEKRERFTKERMIKYRQQIRAFENSRMTADLFSE